MKPVTHGPDQAKKGIISEKSKFQFYVSLWNYDPAGSGRLGEGPKLDFCGLFEDERPKQGPHCGLEVPPAPFQGFLNTPNYPWPACSLHDPFFLFPIPETLSLHLSNSYPILRTSSKWPLLATPVLPHTGPPRPLSPGRPKATCTLLSSKLQPCNVHTGLN